MLFDIKFDGIVTTYYIDTIVYNITEILSPYLNTIRMAPESQTEMENSPAEFHQDVPSIPTLLALLICFLVEQKNIPCHRSQLDDIISATLTYYLLHFFWKISKQN